MSKKLLLGNEAVARGLYEAGVTVVSSYPGTPSTEITETVCQYNEIYTEWAPNEKVAFEVAFGAATAGARAFCAMKHVGLNVAADPLYTASYIGVNGGMVCAVADDPGIHSSQNEQDSRRHAIASKVPMLEPADSQECLDYTKEAFALSEAFDTPVLLRLSTRISHSRSLAAQSERIDYVKKKYEKNIMKNVMMPAMARPAHEKVEQRTRALTQWADTVAFERGVNAIEYNNKDIGVIAAGTSYIYAKEALGTNASFYKLGIVNPLPEKTLLEFASQVKTLYVIEELDDIIETHCLKLGLKVKGKEVFGWTGEFSQNVIKKKILGEKIQSESFGAALPPRPPVLCAGCPHRGLFYALKPFNLFVSGDIGCYTLGAQAPLSMIDTVVCMGASVSGLHGYNLAMGEAAAQKSVAVIGDSTFIHSGITGLIDIVYNKGISTVIILDNSTTGMTGHQHNPANGMTIKGDPTAAVNLEALARAIGINRIAVVDPADIAEARRVVSEELAAAEPSLVIARRPCALLKTVRHAPALTVDRNACTGCRVCLSVGCPALSVQDKKANIDGLQCTGCGVCSYACKFNAIQTSKGEANA